MARFHVILAGDRTTVTVHRTLAALLAIKLGLEPETREAHRAVRKWLQKVLDRGGKRWEHPSQWLAGQIAVTVAENEISNAYRRWQEENP